MEAKTRSAYMKYPKEIPASAGSLVEKPKTEAAQEAMARILAETCILPRRIKMRQMMATIIMAEVSLKVPMAAAEPLAKERMARIVMMKMKKRQRMAMNRALRKATKFSLSIRMRK